MRKLVAKLVYALAGFARLFVYKYPKSDSTSTVVLLFDNGENTIVVERGRGPFTGWLAFPGGFLNVGTETLRRAGKRELQEETTIDLPEDMFHAVDTRSEPDRDPRGHVVDHGWLVIVPATMKESVVSQLAAKDDARGAFVVPVSKLLADGMAFDHRLLLVRALELHARLST
jgi:ADP-ribose pyrophosphatase YjhB (NUDIX family)